MRTLRLASSEIGRHTHPLHRLAVAFLFVVPCLYGALYLWSNWDPYGSLDQVPVAVVDLDEPVTVDGTRIAAGEQLVEQLEEDRIFGWVFTDAEDAAEGLDEGRYYMTITVPEDFSARLASGADGTPQRAEVEMRRNDANGFVVGIMAETVQTQLQEQINAAATQAYFESVYGSLDALRDGVAQADAGAAQLRDGLAAADPGAAELATGLDEASSGAQEVADGAAQVADGTQQVADVVDPLADQIVPALPGIAEGAAGVTASAAEVTALASEGADSLSTRTQEVDDALAQLVADHPELADDPSFVQVQDATGRVNERAGEIATAAGELDAAAQALNGDAQALVTAVPDLQQRVQDGRDRVDELNSGAHQVADGARTLADNLGPAATGAHELADGVHEASTGAAELTEGLDAILASVPALDADTRERNAAILGDPTDVTLTVDNPAEVYGRGLAPFFFSIALWVFGIVVFLVLRPTTGRALASTASPLRIALAGWLPIFGIGLAGAYLLLAVSAFGLGLDPVDWAGSVGIVALAVAVFTLLAHLARTALGLVGSAVLLVLLMLQLTSSAGIYPAETLPGPLRALHPYLPMTYLVDAFRVVFTGGSAAHLARDAVMLGAVGVAAFAATCWVMARKRTWTMATVHPQLGG